VANALVLDMPVEPGLEAMAVVGPDFLDFPSMPDIGHGKRLRRRTTRRFSLGLAAAITPSRKLVETSSRRNGQGSGLLI
jgi:hypothetical protein